MSQAERGRAYRRCDDRLDRRIDCGHDDSRTERLGDMTSKKRVPKSRIRARKKTAKPRARVKIGDVARHAKVSVGTVSNVLNDRSTVKAERRERVLNAIKELGFSESLLAKGMRAQRYPVVGLCVPDATFSGFASLLNALEEKASLANYEVIQVSSHGEPEREFTRIRRLVAFKVSGLILVPSPEPGGVLDFLSAANVPTVLVRRAVEDEPRFDQVSMDNRAMMNKVCRELFAIGHRRFLFVCQYAHLKITHHRIDVLNRMVAETGRQMSYQAMECGPTQADFLARVSTELNGKEPPTVVLVANGLVASWTIQAFHALGLRCPEQVSLVCLDEPEWAEVVTPRLASVRQPTHEMTQSAWDLLRMRMDGGMQPRQHTLCDGALIFRESVAPPKSAATPARAALPISAPRDRVPPA
jgi:LacI family transcriptional regulator